MRERPYTTDEWDAVRWAAGAITEAAQAGDLPGRAARFEDLRSILAELRERHGDHPLLWETEADFTPDAAAAAELYRLAEVAAPAANWPTITIRLSLARLLAEELGQPGEARDILQICRDELPWAAESDCTAWAALLAACPPEFPSVFGDAPAAPSESDGELVGAAAPVESPFRLERPTR